MERGRTDWQVFTHSVPWRDIAIGFIVPKVIFYISMNRSWMSAGVGVAVLWCVGLFVLEYLRLRKANIWAILALITILFQLIPVMMRKDPNLNFVAGGVTAFLYGLAFIVSSLIRRPIIQIIAEHAGAKEHVPSQIISSPYYLRAWMIVTSVWGAVYIVEALLIFALSSDRSGALLAADAISSWPTMIVMIFFTVKFPRHYWNRVMASGRVVR